MFRILSILAFSALCIHPDRASADALKPHESSASEISSSTVRVHMAWPDPQYSLQALSECQNSVLNNRLQSAAVPLRHNNGMGTALSVLLALASTKEGTQRSPAADCAFCAPRHKP
jgi:hypothetical protein